MEKQTKAKKTKHKVKAVRVTSGDKIKSDVQGSYTGVPLEGDERPVQDADDL